MWGAVTLRHLPRDHSYNERFRRLRLAFAFAFRNLFWALNAPVNAGKRTAKGELSAELPHGNRSR